MVKLLFVDIDGTLTETISGHAFKQHPKDVKVMEGAHKAVTHFADKGWLVIGISNQGGVAAGHKTLDATCEEFDYTLELFRGLSAIYFCPDFEGYWCYWIDREDAGREYRDYGINFRKPSPGIVHKLLYETGAKAENCWLVGDRPEDEQAAANAMANFCPASIWRDRFKTGMFTHQVTPAQLRFLEGVELGGG